MDYGAMRQNLLDAGCSGAMIEEIMALSREGKFPEALRIMKKDRCRLMDDLHESGRKVDCMDFLIRKTEKQIRKTERAMKQAD